MTTVEPTLRLAKLSEAAEIARLSRAVVEYGLRWSWRPERVAASIRDPNVHVLVARTDDHVAGFAIMRYGDEVARLELFGVAHLYRRMGIGRRLHAWLEKCALVAGIAEIRLEVRAANRGAQTFYERLGYRKLAYLPGYYQGREAAIRMERLLRGGDGATASQSTSGGQRLAH
jgi:[ribosomal protein S18]-alanine N-acetyltransferase